MKSFKLEDMTKGWFIGNFNPTLAPSDDVEVAIKTYKKGDKEPRHVHKIATEYTAIVSGKVMMNGKIYEAGSIVVIEPNEPTDFECLMDNTVNVVVKLPCSKNDKYLI